MGSVATSADSRCSDVDKALSSAALVSPGTCAWVAVLYASMMSLLAPSDVVLTLHCRRSVLESMVS